MIRIPITMCHGTRPDSSDKALTMEYFDSLIRIASEMQCSSINYDQLESWRNGKGSLPERPIMFDFDHPMKSMLHEVHPILARYGFRGNLFINTGVMNPEDVPEGYGECMSWAEISELVAAGWHIGAHTVSHPDLSALSLEDPGGNKLREELVECDETIEKHLGIRPRDFAFTGTSFSRVARDEVAKRYRFGRLWITQAHYDVDGEKVRYADLVGVEGDDEADGGPPMAARYITKETDPYLLPSMEIQALIHGRGDFREYIGGSFS